MQRSVFLSMTIVFFVLVAWIFARRHSAKSFAPQTEQTPLVETQDAKKPNSNLKNSERPSQIENPNSEKSKTLATSPTKSNTNASLPLLIALVPDQSTLRDEVAKDPEKTPTALIGFSVEINERMEASISSSEASEKLFSEFETCVLNDGNTPHRPARSAQALCLLNANRLSARHTELKDRYKFLEQKAAPEIVSLTHAML